MGCGGFGAGSFGAGPWGAGLGAGLASALQTARNAIAVTFLGPPKATDPAGFKDALNPARWRLEVREPADAVLRLVQIVESTSNPLVLTVFTDLQLTPLAVYRILIEGAVDQAGLPIVSPCNFADFSTFDTFRLRGAPAVQEQRTDLNNPQLISDAELIDPPPLGTYQINDRGDFALERGSAYLRKRVIRRATSPFASFFHLPTYGFAEPLKSTITPDVLRRLQARAQAQILREPDVIRATVTVRRDATTPNLVVMEFRVVDREGNVASGDIPVDLGTL